MTTRRDEKTHRRGPTIINVFTRLNPVWIITLILLADFHHADSFSPSRSVGTPFPFSTDIARRKMTQCFSYQEKNVGNEQIENERSDISNVRQQTLSSKDKIVRHKLNINRRDALFAGAALVLLAPSESSAFIDPVDGNAKKPSRTLEDLNLGVGKWTEQKEFKGKGESMQRLTIPPAFATYATRLLIKYDEGASSWWNGKLDAYSLLPTDTIRYKLGDDFGTFARSVQMALEDYVGQTETDGMDTIIQDRFSELANIFINSYGTNDDILRQIGILFTMLPREYQPMKILKKLASMAPTPDIYVGEQSESTYFADQLTKLLPSEYRCAFDTDTNSFNISPAIDFGVPDEYGENAITTMFGPLSSSPLKRQRPNLSLAIYSLFGISGAAGCAITHTLVIPFDVVKTRLQTNPDQYSNIIDGAVTIAKTEGMRAFSLGGEATLAGYCWYGLTVYPSYAFFKWYLEHSLLTSAYAAAHVNDIALIAGALAAVIASIGLTPMEACRIRTVAEPETYRDIGLLGTMGVIANENPQLGWKGLYAGLPSLLARQVTFGSVKFLAFERACDAIYYSFPELRGATLTALGVSLAGGAFSGALSSVVSQPADSILTYVSKNSQELEEGGILESAQLMVKNEGAGSLFRGLGSRCLWASCIISGQFCLYDIFRSFFGINAEDLVQVFQVLINGQGMTIN